ncbi:hypothetical protein BDR26DRAFT_866032 [Obelidium mucronatum]|nr:hypothetical protein BDR26DRAFT_866032 [Obelidium mucronatum]
MIKRRSVPDPKLENKRLKVNASKDSSKVKVVVPACRSSINASLEMKSVSLESHSYQQMRELLKQNGYVCVRSLVPRKTVRKARDHVLRYLDDTGFIAPNTTEGISDSMQGDQSPNLLQNQKLAFSEPIMNATGHRNIVQLVNELLLEETAPPSFIAPDIESTAGALKPKSLKPPPPNHMFPDVTQIPYSWLRAVPTDKCTGPHLDRVYLGAGSQKILTVWMPFTNVPVSRGSLCVASRSHVSDALKGFRETYGSVPAGRDGTSSGWVTEFPDQIEKMYGIPQKRRENGGEDEDEEENVCGPGIEWVTRDFEMGDVVIFGLDLLHMTLNNVTDLWRVSCETRWQPTGDAYPPFFHLKS